VVQKSKLKATNVNVFSVYLQMADCSLSWP